MAGGSDNLLPPIQPGEVRNPRGINQYTYRKNAEATFDRLLRSVAARGEKTVSEAILEDLCAMAQEKNTWAIDRVLERILPKVDKHEVEMPAGGEVKVPSSSDRLREVMGILSEHGLLGDQE